MHKSSILATFVLAALIGCDQAEDQANQDQPPAGEQQQQQAPQPEPRVAAAGEGARGQGYGGGPVSEPIKQRFLIEERIIFLNITAAMNMFYAEHQRNPESHEEFMEKIIEINHINLPELRAGETYQYDPEALDEETGRNGMLMIVRQPAG